MVVTFEVNKSRAPYLAKVYHTTVVHINAMKREIDDLVKNNALEQYEWSSEWTAPTLGTKEKRLF